MNELLNTEPIPAPTTETGSDVYEPFTGGFLHILGLVTHKVQDRNIQERSWRASQFHEIQSLRSELHQANIEARIFTPTLETISNTNQEQPERNMASIHKKILSKFDEARERARLSNEVRASKLYSVDMGELYGINKGLVSILNPDATGEPIVFLPGSGSQPDSYLNTAVELAYQTKKKIVMCCPPDAPGGRMTLRFAADSISNLTGKEKMHPKATDEELYVYCTKNTIKTTNRPDNFQPNHILHREFMIKLIELVIPSDQKYHLMGHSYGGLIATDILQHGTSDVINRFLSIVSVNQAGAWTLSTENTFRLSVAIDEVKRNIKNIPNLSFILDKMTIGLSGEPPKNSEATINQARPSPLKSLISDIKKDGLRATVQSYVSRFKRYLIRDNVTKAVMYSAPIQNTNWDTITPPAHVPFVVIGGPDKATGIEHAIDYLQTHRSVSSDIIPIYRKEYDHSALNMFPVPIITDIISVIPGIRNTPVTA